MPKLHLEVFPDEQSALWRLFGEHSQEISQLEYYLAGGTALALQIGHRQSVDFDFFSSKKSIGISSQDWLSTLPHATIRDTDEHTAHSDIQGVKVSLIGSYRYPLLEKAVDSDNGIRLAGILDIGLMKLLSITHRAALRDYLDLAIIIRDHVPIKTLCERSMEKYGDSFNIMIPLRALVSFIDLDGEVPILLDRTLGETWQDILKEAVRSIAL